MEVAGRNGIEVEDETEPQIHENFSRVLDTVRYAVCHQNYPQVLLGQDFYKFFIDETLKAIDNLPIDSGEGKIKSNKLEKGCIFFAFEGGDSLNTARNNMPNADEIKITDYNNIPRLIYRTYTYEEDFDTVVFKHRIARQNRGLKVHEWRIFDSVPRKTKTGWS